jgi:hypothetical protein
MIENKFDPTVYIMERGVVACHDNIPISVEINLAICATVWKKETTYLVKYGST